MTTAATPRATAPVTAFSIWSGPDDVERKGRLTLAWDAAIAKSQDLRQALMVIDLVLGSGERFRVATSLIDSVAVSGDERFVRPVLVEEAQIVNDYDLGNATSRARSVEFTIPGWNVESLQRRRSTEPLAGFAEVSLMVDGMAWRDRRIIMRGDMAGGVSFGGHQEGGTQRADGLLQSCTDQPFTFAVQDPRETADSAFPPFVVDEVSWPDAHPNAIGEPYPIVFGGYTTIALRVVDGTDPDFLAVYQHGWNVVAVFRNGDDETGNFSAVETVDANGIPVTLVSPTPAAFTWEDGDEVLVELEHDADPTPKLLDVIREVITEFSVGGVAMLSGELFAEAEVALPATVRVRAKADESTSVLRWIEDALLEDFPMVAMAFRAGRYGPIVTDYRRPPVLTLEAGQHLLRFRTGLAAESPKGDALNQFTLRYDFDTRLDQFTKVMTRDPSNTPECRASEQAIGPRPDPSGPVESVVIFDDVTGAYVLDWRVAHEAVLSEFLEYAASPSLWFRLQSGNSVDVEDPEMLFAPARATIERMAYQRGLLLLGVRVWREPRRTGI